MTSHFEASENRTSPIGRYEIIQKIGDGGFANVYLAEDRELEDHVAIKVLKPPHTEDADLVQRFLNEGRLLRRMKCSGLLAIYDLGNEQGRPYIVTEYCAGGSLRDRLTEIGRKLFPEEALALARSIGVAMADIHATQPPLAHRDIKPANLLIRQLRHTSGEPIGDLLRADEEIVVADFGIAKALTEHNTQNSRLIYTTGYAAPELAKGQTGINQSADGVAPSLVNSLA